MRYVFLAFLSAQLVAHRAEVAGVAWQHLSSATNQLPVPSSAKVHAGSVVGDFDGDKTNDFILAFADAAPALVLYRSTNSPTNWSRIPIELEFLPIAPGGAVHDIDDDDDLDVVFGSDSGSEIWWWENPRPNFDPNKSWTRRTIRTSGSSTNRGQIFADILGKGTPQLIYWNQGTNHVFLSEIPGEVRGRTNWPRIKLMSVIGTPGYMHTLVPTDIDIDGDADLLAGNYLLIRKPGLSFEMAQILIGAYGTRSEDLLASGRGGIGRFREGTYAQIVLAPHKERGYVYWHECKSDPDKPQSWARRQLLGHPVAPAASLAIGDINKDGNDDIFLAEMREASRTSTPHSPNAWIFYSDGRGNFKATIFSTGLEIFEAKLADLDNDTDLDLVSTPNKAGTPRLDIWLNVTDLSKPQPQPQ